MNKEIIEFIKTSKYVSLHLWKDVFQVLSHNNKNGLLVSQTQLLVCDVSKMCDTILVSHGKPFYTLSRDEIKEIWLFIKDILDKQKLNQKINEEEKCEIESRRDLHLLKSIQK